MSIATKRGDGGETGLAGGIRVSKSSLRVETYGTVDELNSALGLARSMCEDADLRERTKVIQRELFRIGSALADSTGEQQTAGSGAAGKVDELTRQVHELEATEGPVVGLVAAGRDGGGRRVRSGAHGVPPRRALRGAADGVRRGGGTEHPGLPESPLGFVVALRAQGGVGRRRASNSLREINGKSGPRWSRAW